MIAATLGWIGTAGTLMAYLSLSRGWLSNASKLYAALNIVGGVLAGTASTLYGAWPSAASNYVWAVISAISITAMYRGGAARTRLPAEAYAALVQFPNAEAASAPARV